MTSAPRPPAKKSARARAARAWQRRTLTAVQAAVRAELAERFAGKPHEERLSGLMREVQILAADDGVAGAIRRYVYIVHTLTTHERGGGLTTAQVKRLIDLAYAILRVAGIEPTSRDLGFLYGDLHVVHSQILRQNGRHWDAVWDQGLAQRFRGGKAASGFPAMVAGNRALRLGQATLAIQCFEQAVATGLSATALARARLGLVTAHRLAGRLDAARAAVERGVAELKPDGAMALEFSWSRLLLDFAATRDLELLVRATAPRGSHHEAGYLIEVALWTHALQERQAIDRGRKLENMVKSARLSPRKYGFMFTAAKVLGGCYDAEVPLILRYRRLGECLASRHRLLNVDKELLLWAGAIRWLSRTKSFWFATLCLNEYRALSAKLADGGGRDALLVLGDLEAADWAAGQSFLGPGRESA